jgi:type VI secretion system protein ImpH
MKNPVFSRPRDLLEKLEKDAPHFGFFQAVRLLALSARKSGKKRRGPLPDGLRFRTVPSLAFPPSELVAYRPADPGTPDAGNARDELTVAVMGLTGPGGVLPPPYTELVYGRRQVYRDTAIHAFFDLFSHHATGLFYGAWRKYRYWLGVEDGEPDGLTRGLLGLSGVGTQRLRGKLGVVGETHLAENLFAYYAGLLSQKPISALSVGTVVRGFFGIPAEVEQFVGQWVDVPPGEQSRFGSNLCELGLSAFAGERIWDRQTKIRIRLGPMPLEKFESLLPGGEAAKELESLVRYMVGHSLACDVTLVLDRREIPDARFSPQSRSLLGGNVWLSTRPLEHDPDEMQYRLLQ